MFSTHRLCCQRMATPNTTRPAHPNVSCRTRLWCWKASKTRMDTSTSPASASSFPLLALPDPLLLAVLQRLTAADDYRSLFGAARAHSRLHQAAVVALSSITACVYTQQQANALMPYLSRHGQHVTSLDLWGRDSYGNQEDPFTLRQLPPALQLRRLWCCDVGLQLRPGHGFPGVLGPAAATLQHLQLSDCSLLDGEEGLAEALLLLPKLEHLDLLTCEDATPGVEDCLVFPTDVLAHLQQLTYLQLDIELDYHDSGSLDLGPLSALTRLAGLQLHFHGRNARGTMPNTLSSTRLTSLVLSGNVMFEPAVLTGSTQLQHLELCGTQASPAGAAGAAQLLLQLPSLQQLTCLRLLRSIVWKDGRVPATDFRALTASSMLQRLELIGCVLPAGAWEHVFPACRRLPHLRWLNLSGLKQPSGNPAAAPACSRLVSCCPGLQVLDIERLQYTAEPQGPLLGLSSLQHPHTVGLAAAGGSAHTHRPAGALERSMLQLAALKDLQNLKIQGLLDGVNTIWIEMTSWARGGEPVWRQLLRHLLNSSDPAVAQQATAALAQ